MVKNYGLNCLRVNGFDVGVIVIPSNSVATLSFTSDAAYKNIIFVSKKPTECIIHVANNKTTNGLEDFVIENPCNYPISIFVSAFHLNPDTMRLVQNSMRKVVTDRNNYSYGFEDGTDADYNDIVVNVQIEKLC
ncbi:DUF4114 domain-containing protein [Clostridioides difficile]